MSRKSIYSLFVVSLKRHDKEHEKMDMGREERPARIHFFKVPGEKS
jgi:hypothetical protein